MEVGGLTDRDPLSAWQLVGIVSVEYTDRVQCERRGCGRGVYAAIYIIRWPDGSLECWGGDCYSRLLGGAARERGITPMLPGLNGRRLTDDERAMLLQNRETLIARFVAQHERAQQELARAEADRAAAERAERDRVDREEAARWARYEQRSRESPPVPRTDGAARRARRDAVAAPTRPLPEPMDDPRYVAIRQRLEARWREHGVDPESIEGRRTLVENALRQYDRGR